MTTSASSDPSRMTRNGSGSGSSSSSSSRRRAMISLLLRPLFVLATISLLVLLALYDDDDFLPSSSSSNDFDARRGLRLDDIDEEEEEEAMMTTRHLDGGSMMHNIVIDEYGERFAGVRYRDDDDDEEEEDDRRSLSHTIEHLIVKLNPHHSNPAEKCEMLARSIYGTVNTVFDGDAFKGCEIVMSDMSTMNDGDPLPLVDESGVYAVEEDGIVEAYNQAGGSGVGVVVDAIWNLDRLDQCALPLDGNYVKEDASGVRIFVMDTGIRGDHEEFVGMIDTNSPCHFSVVDSPMMPLYDGNGHGTHVAGTACGHRYGVARNCELCSVKVLNSAGFGSWSGMISGLNHIVSYCTANTDKRCVANLSLGGGYSAIMNDAVSAAVASGVTVVVAAGNSARSACLSSPASATTSLSVGSTTIIDSMSSFSNYGTCVDVYAPGTNILSASNGNVNMYSSKMGTSMACPHVSAIASGLLTSYPELTPSQVSTAIVGSAIYLGGVHNMMLATSTTGERCGPTKTPTKTPTKSPTKYPTVPPTSRPTPTCVHKNKYLGPTSTHCTVGNRVGRSSLCCSGRCFDPLSRGKAYCR